MNYQKILFGFTLAFSIVLEFCVRYFDLWNTIPYCDKIMHFFWGFNIFLMLVIIFKWKPTDALIGVFVWQMVWELVEMIVDVVVAQPDYMLDFFYFDGIKDTLTDLAGGLLAWLIILNIKSKDKLKSYLNMNTVYVFVSCIFVVILVGSVISLQAGESQNKFAVVGITASLIIAGIYYLWYYLLFARNSRK